MNPDICGHAKKVSISWEGHVTDIVCTYKRPHGDCISDYCPLDRAIKLKKEQLEQNKQNKQNK